MRTIPRGRPTTAARAALASGVPGAIAGMVSAAIPPFLVGSLSIAMADDVGFSVAALGTAVSASYVVSALLSPVAGRLVQRLGAVPALRLTCGLTTLGLTILVFAGSRPAVLIALAVLGVPNALIQPASNHTLATITAPRARALLFGVVQSAIPTATMLSGLLLAGFNRGSTWRDAILCTALFTLVAQLAIRGRAPAQVGGFGTNGGAADASCEPQRPLLLGVLAVGGFLGSASATTLAIFGSAGAVDAGLSAGSAATCQVLGSLCCIAVRTLASWYGGVGSGRAIIGRVAALIAVGAGGFAVLAFRQTSLFPVGLAVAFACGWGWTGLFNLTVARARPGQVARATGLTQSGLFLGSVTGPALFGILTHNVGYAAGWWLCVTIAAGAATCAALSALLWSRPPAREPLPEAAAPTA